MNTSYRSIFSHVLGTWVAVSEVAAGRGKRTGSAVALAAVMSLLSASPAGAQSALYWDINGATAGAGGATPNGGWSTAATNWSTATAGNVATGAWVNGSTAVFAAGTDATGSYAINLANDLAAAGLTYRGGTASSQLTLSGANILTLTGTTMPQVTVDANTTLSVNTVVAGTDGLLKSGAGTLALAGINNTYTGGTVIAGGTLGISSDGSLGNSAGGVTLTNGATLRLDAVGINSNRAIDLLGAGGRIDVNATEGAMLTGSITGGGRLTVVNTGVYENNEDIRLILQGNNGYVGGTVLGIAGVVGGRVNVQVVGSGTALGTGPVDIYMNSEMKFTGATATAGSLSFTTHESTNYLGTNSGVYFDGGASAGSSNISIQALGSYVIFDGAGTTAGNSTIDNNSGRVQFYGASLGGNTTITNTNGGMVDVHDTADLSTATVHNTNGQVFISNLTASGVAIGSLDGAGAVVLGGKTLTLGGLGRDDTISGVISDTGRGYLDAMNRDYVTQATATGGSLVKEGAGTLVLSGNNTYAGGTQLVDGTLVANNNQALGTGALTIRGGTLGSQTNAVVANNVVVQGDFGIAASGSATPSLTLAGNVSLASTAKITQANAGTVNFTGAIGGAQGLTLDASAAGARYVFSGSQSNTYSGTTTVQGNALLDLQKSGGATAVAGNLGVSDQGAVLLNASEQIANTATVNLGGTGQGGNDALQFGAAGLTETIGTLTGSGNVGLNGSQLVVGSGDFSGQVRDNGASGGGLTKVGTGTLRLSGANSYSGATTVSAGTLQAGAAQAFSASSAHSVATGAVLDTGGFNQTVASLSNSGTVSLLGAAPGSSLTVNGAYVGNNGTLRLGAALNATGPSDQLVLNGAGASASGRTNVQVVNLGGLGALTAGAGIEVIAARNGATTTAQTTRDAFSLVGGHVDAGAFEYRLYAADQNGAGDSWYLRSTNVTPTVDPNKADPTQQETPRYRAEVPMFAALPAQLRQADMTMLGNLHRRVGDEDPRGASAEFGDRRAWARLIGADLDIRQQGTVSPASSGHLQGVQAGTDLFAMPSSNWRAGIYVGQMDGDADVSGLARDGWGAVGSTDMRSRYFGAYATYSAPIGFYADAVLQYGKHDYSFNPYGNAQVSGKGDGVQASIEVGQSIGMGGSWFIEPQAQLVHEQINLDAVNLGGTTVNNDASSGWLARLGVRVRGQVSTGIGSLQPYARANLYRSSNGQDLVRFSTPVASTTIASPSDYTSAELAGGFTLTVSPTISFYSEIGRLFDIGGDAKVKSSIEGSAGMRVRW